LQKIANRWPREEIGKHDFRESQNAIQGWRHVLKFSTMQP
jgi:hypothetical protein